MIAQPFLVLANWKANSPKVSDFGFRASDFVEVAAAAPYPLIPSIPPEFSRASQDVSAFPIGPHTGEIPASLLKSLGVRYTLVGHSERRKDLKETNTDVELKMKQAIEVGIIPIICAQTIDEIPANIRNFDATQFMIMYEPSEAISIEGNYHPESPEKINSVLSDWQQKLNLKCRLLYGGSVNIENCKLLIANCRMLSGFVIGHASLSADEFSSIIVSCQKSLASSAES